MSRISKNVVGAVLGAALLMGSNALGIGVDVDTILTDYPGMGLSGSVDMEISGNTLTIVLQNTSVSSVTGADALLTGIAFNLGNGWNITGGQVYIATGSQGVGDAPTPYAEDTDVSGEYGYLNGISGHFNDASTATDTQVSAMGADGITKFSSTPLEEPPAVLDGPEWGLLATGGDAGGNAYIQNAVRIVLTLNKSVTAGGEADFINDINLGEVAITFGSPEGGTSVPDASSGMMLLGLALCGLEGLRRKFKI